MQHENKFRWVALFVGIAAGLLLMFLGARVVLASFHEGCVDMMEHEHGLLCNGGYTTTDRGVEIEAGRALLWFAKGSQRVQRMWLTDGVVVKFSTRRSVQAKGSANQAEYRLDKREIALLGKASLEIGPENLSGDRLEYSLTFDRLLRRSAATKP